MRLFKKECERKFLVKELPSDFNDYDKEDVHQYYPIVSKYFCVRVRKYSETRKYLDIKFGSGKIKFKIGLRINFFQTNKKCLVKTRHKKRFNNLLIVIDIFESGLRLVEIESSDCSIIDNYKLPEWFGEEVTNDKKYRNRYLIKK